MKKKTKKKDKKKYEPKVVNYPVIRVNHDRLRFKISKKLSGRGGTTVVTCEIAKGVVYLGYANCWKMEQYKKIKGKSIAFGRLMRAISIPGDSTWNKEIEVKIRAQIGKIDEELFQNARLGIKPVDPVKIYTNGENPE